MQAQLSPYHTGKDKPGAERAHLESRSGGFMRPEDLMKSDRISETVLLSSALMLLVILTVIVTAALTQTAALP
jgi:hypothetical protein